MARLSSPSLRFLLVFSISVLYLCALPLRGQADDVTWSIAPEGGPGSLSWVLEPGSTQEGAVKITNHNLTSLHLDLQTLDATTTTDGHLDLVESPEVNTNLGKWISMDTHPLNIPAGQSITLPFKVHVPADAAPGDYSAGITTLYRSQGTTVSVNHRNATRVDVRVPGDIKLAHAIADIASKGTSTWSLTAPGQVSTDYKLTNVGNARIYVLETVRVSSLFGLYTAEKSERLPEVLPGHTLERKVALPAWGFGPTKVTVTTRSMGIDESPGTTQVLESSATVVQTSWAAIALVLLAVAIGIGVWLGRRKTRSTAHPQADDI
ncbi:WxL protein peptidoglycan domain-containing protein [Dermabacteraceae bacterium CCM 9520]